MFSHAGQIRQYNITKKEWVLNGGTVIYADWNSIKDTLDYDFATEKQFSYEGLSVDAAVKHLAKFTSDIWQIHPFGEGNTRATAVFMIKYMKTFGFRVNNDAFEKNSWYFRNALVRANYTNLQKGVHATTKFLEMFFSNLLLGTDYELKNRYMQIDYVEESHPQSINFKVSKYQFDTLDCSLEELAVLELVAQNPAIKRQGARTDLTSPKISAKFRSDDEVGQDTGVSGDTIRNYIALTQLVPELQQMVDEKKIALSPAYQIAALTPKEQGCFWKPSTANRLPPRSHRHSG